MRATALPSRPPLAARTPPTPSRRHVGARSGGGDVQNLLDRDRAVAGVADDAVAASAFDDADIASAEAAAAAAGEGQAEAAPQPKAPARDAAPATPDDGLKTCRQALDRGEALLRAGDAAGALQAFERALDLPGSAAVRLAGSVVETSCPSDAEEAAALYNAACAYVALGQPDAADTMLRAALATAAPPDAETVLSDPDLKPLGDARLRAALAASASAAGGLPVIGGLLKGKKKEGGSAGWLERVLRPW